MQPKTKLLLLVCVIIMIVLFACKREQQSKSKPELLTKVDLKTTSFPALSTIDFDGNKKIDSEKYRKPITTEADAPIMLEFTSKHFRLVAPY